MNRLLILVLFIAGNSFAAGIQKWSDEKGLIHYGDNPPAQAETESIRISRPPSDPGKPLPRFSSEETEDTPPTGQQKPAETSDEEAKALCEKARKDLTIIQRSTRLREKSGDGSIRYLNKEEIEARRIQTEEDIEHFCK